MEAKGLPSVYRVYLQLRSVMPSENDDGGEMHDVHETVIHLLRNSCLLELITLREETVSEISKPPQRRHCGVVNLDRLRGTYGTVAG